MYRITVHAHHKINKKYNSNRLSSSTVWLLFPSIIQIKHKFLLCAKFQQVVYVIFIQNLGIGIEQHSYQVIFTFFYLSSEKNLDAFLKETTERL
jgi:hypothetical protein